MLNIVLFGPPGAGKGTQSEKIINNYGLVHLATGDLLRNEIAQGTDLGLEAKKLMDKGELVPDEVVIGMIRSRLEQNQGAAGFIFDGFPRTEEQAKALDGLLEEEGTSIDLMLSLEVEEQELIDRLLKRGEESGRSDDQDQNTIQNRIREYEKKTAPLKAYYQNQGKYVAVKGVGTIDEIFDRIAGKIDKQLSSKQ